MSQEKINPHVKVQAEAILQGLGLEPEVALNLFYHQVLIHQGLPFAIQGRSPALNQGDDKRLQWEDLQEGTPAFEQTMGSVEAIFEQLAQDFLKDTPADETPSST